MKSKLIVSEDAIILTQIIQMNTKKKFSKTIKLGKKTRVVLIFAVETEANFLVSKGHEKKFLLRKENAKIIIVELVLIKLGVT